MNTNRLKIIHIIPTIGCGGAEVLLTNIAIELAKRGHKIKIVSLNEHHPSFEDLPHKDELLSLCSIVILQPGSDVSILKGNSEKSIELQGIIDEFQPNIIHSHLFESEVVSRSCFYAKAKWFSHCHNNIPQFERFGISTILSKSKFIQFVEKLYLFKRYRKNGGNTFLVISKSTLQYFRNCLPSDLSNIHLTPNAIDFDRFINSKRTFTEKKLKLISVGNLLENKNHKFLLEVVAQLSVRNIDCSLTILGMGECEEKLLSKAISLGVSDVVFLPGTVKNVEDYMQEASIYVHSAYNEAFGLTIVEAMSSGLPVVTLDGKGNRDLIVEGKNGFMLFEENIEMFVDKILEIWTNKTKLKEMSLFAQNYAKQYDIKPYTDRLLTLYQKAISN